MSKQSKEWARRRRYALIYELGGKCANPECGEEEYEKLEFDHIHGKDWEATGLSTDQRMCRYIKEAKLGLLQVMCHVCNAKRGDPKLAPIRELNRIMVEIGNYCATPGCENRFLGDLEFIHASGENWEPPGLPFEERLALYKKEVAEGRLTLMCSECLESEHVIVPVTFTAPELKLSAAEPF